MKSTVNALSRLHGLAKVASDESFKNILEEARHLITVQAPATFRAVMQALAPFRFGLSCGYIHRGGKTGAFWFLNDYGARGTPDAVTERIVDTLAAEGFSKGTSAESEGVKVKMESLKGSLRQSCTIERIAKFTGTRDPRAGGYLIFETELLEESQPLTVQQVIDTWPALECTDMPAPFKEYLYPIPASEVSQGGTWTQYYDWTATFVPERRETTIGLQTLKQLVERQGWVLDRDDRGSLTYFLGKNSAPVVYLSIEAGGEVQFRIQPRM